MWVVVIVRRLSSSSRCVVNAASIESNAWLNVGKQAVPEWRQPCAPALPQEQGRAEPLLERLHLIGDRGLGQAELRGGGGETLVPRGCLEGANGGERRKSSHGLT